MKNHFNTHPKGRINPYSFFCIIASSSPKSKQSSDMVSFPATFTLTFNNSFIELVLPVLVGMYIITARCLGLSEQFRINGREAHVFHSFHFFFFFFLNCILPFSGHWEENTENCLPRDRVEDFSVIYHLFLVSPSSSRK